MRITILGSAAGIPTLDRGLPAILVESDGEQILLDCGEGTQRQMMRVRAGICRKMKVFITHLHGDHLFGLPGLIQTMNLMKRVHPLEVYGPPGLKDFIEETTIATMSEPIFDLRVHEVSQGEICACRGLRVTGAWAEHSIPNMAYRLVFGESAGEFLPERAEALGVPEGPMWSQLKSGRAVVIEGGRMVEPLQVLGEPVRGMSVVYTGDTRPCGSVVALARGADMLIHESTFSSDFRDHADELGHSTAVGAASVAKEAGVKRLILTHISARYPDASCLEDEAKRIFEGSFLAEDLSVYELKR